MTLRELTAREAIRDLAARYALCADGGRFDELVALFTDDGELRIDEREPLRGRDAIRAFLVTTGAGASRELRGVRHHVTTHHIDVVSNDTASGVAYVLVVTEHGLDHWGRYRDRYVRGDTGWRFAARHVRVDRRTPIA